MLKFSNDIQVPVVCTQNNDGTAEVFVPDLNMKCYGEDFTDALASTILKVSAIYYYNKERNIDLKFRTTYEDAMAICGKNSFVTFACISN